MCAAVALALLAAGSGRAQLLVDGAPVTTNTDMLLWLRADRGFTSGATTTWLDQSSYGRVFSGNTAGRMPVLTSSNAAFNNQATITFDGNDFLSRSSAAFSGQQTAFFIYNNTATGNWSEVLGTGAVGNRYSYHGDDTTNGLFLYNSTWTNTETTNGLNLRSGTSIGTGLAASRPSSATIDVNVATAAMTNEVLTVGSNQYTSDVARGINGGVAEIILFNRALSFPELNEVGGYLASRYALEWSTYYPAGTSLSSATGDWSSAGNWTAGAPGTGQSGVVGSGHQLTYDAAASGSAAIVSVTGSGSRLTLSRSLNASSELYVGTGSVVEAGSQALSSPKVSVADRAAFSSTGVLAVTTLRTAGTTTLGSGSVGTVSVVGGRTDLSGGTVTTFNASGGTSYLTDGRVTTFNSTAGIAHLTGGTATTLNAGGATTNLAGTRLTTLNATSGTVNVTAATTATNLSVTSTAARVSLAAASLTTTNGTLKAGLVSTAGTNALVVGAGGQLKVGTNVTLATAGAEALVRGSNLVSPTASERNTLSLGGGTITLTGALGGGASADMTSVRHRWTFDDGTLNDSIGNANGTAENANVFVSNGQLQITGAGRMLTAQSNQTIGARTLMVWTTLTNPATSTKGSALTIENNTTGATFDGIVYGERTARQWMAGSNSFTRTPVSNGGAIETSTAEVMMAIVYNADNSITLYRDGVQYGNTYTQGTLVTYANPFFQIGRRHGTSADTFIGSVNEARVYNTALSAAEIADIYGTFYAPGDIDMPFWDVAVDRSTTLDLPASGVARLGDLVINPAADAAGDTILGITGSASLVRWDSVSLAASGAVLDISGAAGTSTIASLSGVAGSRVDLGARSLTAGNATSTTFDGRITGSGGFTKAGAGALTLSASSSYSGPTMVSGGTMSLSGAGRFGATSAVSLTALGATLDLSAADGDRTIGTLSGSAGSQVVLGLNSLTTGGSASTTFAGVITGSGGLTKIGTGLLTLSGSNSYAGPTTISAGTLALSGAGRFGATSAVDLLTFGAAFNISAADGDRTIGDLSGVAGTSLLLGANSLTTGGAASTAFAGVITGSGGFTKTGVGTLTLTASNSWAGATTVAGGTLALSGVARFGSTSDVSLSASGATLDMSAADGDRTIGTLAGEAGSRLLLGPNSLTTGGAASTTFAGVIESSGGLTKTGNGRLTLSGSNSYAGVTTISGGTLALSGAGRVGATSDVNLSTSGATFDMQLADGARTIGALSGVTNSRVLLGPNSLTVGGAASTTFAGVIGGSGGLRKVGTGALTLTTTQQITGNVTVAEGSLVLDGAPDLLGTASRIDVLANTMIDATSAGLTIGTGQTLGGYGTVAGDLTFVDGSALSPGGSVGLLTGTAGSTVWNGGMRYVFEVNDATGVAGGGESGSGWDLFTTAGTLTLAASGESQILLTIASLTGTATGAAANFNKNISYFWKFAQAAAPIDPFDYGYFSVDATNFAGQNGVEEGVDGTFFVARGDALGGTDEELYVVYYTFAIPEPGTLTLAALGLTGAALAARRRRRVRESSPSPSGRGPG